MPVPSSPSPSPSGERTSSAAKVPRLIVEAAALVIVVAGLRAAQEILGSLLVAAFLSILSYPLVSWLEGRGVPRVVAVVLVLAFDATVLVAVGLVVASLVSDVMVEPDRIERPLHEALTVLARWLGRFGIVLHGADGDLLGTVGGMVDGPSLVAMVTGTLGGVATVLSHTLMITLTMIFILLEAAMFPWKLRAALGNAHADLTALARITAEVQRYLRLKTVINAAAGILVAAFLALADVPFALLFGLFTFFIDYVPSLGSLIAFAVVTAAATIERGVAVGAVAGLGIVVIHTIVLNVIEPAWLGRRFGLSVLVVFLSLIVWGWILGPLGMLFAVPLTVIVKIGLENSPRHRWIGVLLEPSPIGARLGAGIHRRESQ